MFLPITIKCAKIPNVPHYYVTILGAPTIPPCEMHLLCHNTTFPTYRYQMCRNTQCSLSLCHDIRCAYNSTILDAPALWHCVIGIPLWHCVIGMPLWHCVIGMPLWHCVIGMPLWHCVIGMPLWHCVIGMPRWLSRVSARQSNHVRWTISHLTSAIVAEQRDSPIALTL